MKKKRRPEKTATMEVWNIPSINSDTTFRVTQPTNTCFIFCFFSAMMINGTMPNTESARIGR